MTINLPTSIDRTSDNLRAVAHPVRLLLILVLREACQGLSVQQIQQQLAIDHTTVSHHLSLLRHKGIVTATPKGNERLYSLRNTRLAEAVSVLLV